MRKSFLLASAFRSPLNAAQRIATAMSLRQFVSCGLHWGEIALVLERSCLMAAARPKECRRARRPALLAGRQNPGPYIGRGRAEDSAEHAIEIRKISKAGLKCDSTDRPVAETRIGEHAVRPGEPLFEDVLGECGTLGF